MIYDEGDYFGGTVNIAAGFRLVKVGPVELKGVRKPVTIYQAVRHDC